MDHAGIEVDVVPTKRHELFSTYAHQQWDYHQPDVFICSACHERSDLSICKLAPRRLRSFEPGDLRSFEPGDLCSSQPTRLTGWLTSEKCRHPGLLHQHRRRQRGAGDEVSEPRREETQQERSPHAERRIEPVIGAPWFVARSSGFQKVYSRRSLACSFAKRSSAVR